MELEKKEHNKCGGRKKVTDKRHQLINRSFSSCTCFNETLETSDVNLGENFHRQRNKTLFVDCRRDGRGGKKVKNLREDVKHES